MHFKLIFILLTFITSTAEANTYLKKVCQLPNSSLEIFYLDADGSGFRSHLAPFVGETCAAPGNCDLGLVRQETLCAAFNYISTFANIPNNVQITVLPSAKVQGGFLGRSIPLFQGAPNPSVFDYGPFQSKVVLGVDRNGSVPVGATDPAINSEMNLQFSFPDTGIREMNHDHKANNLSLDIYQIGVYDLMSVALRAILKGMGFYSLVGPQGQPRGQAPVFFGGVAQRTTWNTFLSVIQNNEFELHLRPFITQAGNYFKYSPEFGHIPNTALYTFDGYDSQLTLEYFADSDTPLTTFFEKNTLYRNLSYGEITFLCNAKYLNCLEQETILPPLAQEDYVDYQIGNQNPVCIPVLLNDFDPNIFSLSIAPHSVSVITGGNQNSFSIVNNEVCFKPDANFSGVAVLVYRPFNGKLQGHLTNIYVNVRPQIYEQYCNYIDNGGFEQSGPEGFCGITTRYTVKSWMTLSGSPDLLRTICGSQFKIPNGPLLYTMGVGGLKLLPAPVEIGGNNTAAIRIFDNTKAGISDDYETERLGQNLLSKIKTGKKYRVRADLTNAAKVKANATLRFYFYDIPIQNVNFLTTPHKQLVEIEVNNWKLPHQSYHTDFVANHDAMSVIMVTHIDNQTYYGQVVDNVSIIKTEVPSVFVSVTSNQVIVQKDDIVKFKVKTCVVEEDAPNVTTRFKLPAEFSLISSDMNGPTQLEHEYSDFPKNSCDTRIVEAIFNGKPLNNLNFNSMFACAATDLDENLNNCHGPKDGKECLELQTPEIDLSIDKKLLIPSDPAKIKGTQGEEFHFEILVTNQSTNYSAREIKLSEIPDSSLSFAGVVSFETIGFSGSNLIYDPMSNKILIDSIYPKKSVRIVLKFILKKKACGEKIKNGVIIDGFSELDVILQNNYSEVSLDTPECTCIAEENPNTITQVVQSFGYNFGANNNGWGQQTISCNTDGNCTHEYTGGTEGNGLRCTVCPYVDKFGRCVVKNETGQYIYSDCHKKGVKCFTTGDGAIAQYCNDNSCIPNQFTPLAIGPNDHYGNVYQDIYQYVGDFPLGNLGIITPIYWDSTCVCKPGMEGEGGDIGKKKDNKSKGASDIKGIKGQCTPAPVIKKINLQAITIKGVAKNEIGSKKLK